MRCDPGWGSGWVGTTVGEGREAGQQVTVATVLHVDSPSIANDTCASLLIPYLADLSGARQFQEGCPRLLLIASSLQPPARTTSRAGADHLQYQLYSAPLLPSGQPVCPFAGEAKDRVRDGRTWTRSRPLALLPFHWSPGVCGCVWLGWLDVARLARGVLSCWGAGE